MHAVSLQPDPDSIAYREDALVARHRYHALRWLAGDDDVHVHVGAGRLHELDDSPELSIGRGCQFDVVRTDASDVARRSTPATPRKIFIGGVPRKRAANSVRGWL